MLQGPSKRVVGRDNTHENRARKACMEGTYEVPMTPSPQGHSRENKCPLSGLAGGRGSDMTKCFHLLLTTLLGSGPFPFKFDNTSVPKGQKFPDSCRQSRFQLCGGSG